MSEWIRDFMPHLKTLRAASIRAFFITLYLRESRDLRESATAESGQGQVVGDH